jgi:anti-sigma factor RsiW
VTRPDRQRGGDAGSDPSRPRQEERLTRGEERMLRGYARGRARDEAARAALEPLAPGERPLAVTLAAILAAVLGLANVALLISGYEVEGSGQSAAGALIFAGLMAAAAIGMWQCRYWAVLGFEALLGIAIIFAALSLLVASNVVAVLLCLAIVAICGPLFWFLIRAMARIQLPSRRPREPVG